MATEKARRKLEAVFLPDSNAVVCDCHGWGWGFQFISKLMREKSADRKIEMLQEHMSGWVTEICVALQCINYILRISGPKAFEYYGNVQDDIDRLYRMLHEAQRAMQDEDKLASGSILDSPYSMLVEAEARLVDILDGESVPEENELVAATFSMQDVVKFTKKTVKAGRRNKD